MLMKSIQQDHRSTIYSKPPKEKIGPVVGQNIVVNSYELKTDIPVLIV